jgi:hypothetical protein
MVTLEIPEILLAMLIPPWPRSFASMARYCLRCLALRVGSMALILSESAPWSWAEGGEEYELKIPIVISCQDQKGKSSSFFLFSWASFPYSSSQGNGPSS